MVKRFKRRLASVLTGMAVCAAFVLSIFLLPSFHGEAEAQSRYAELDRAPAFMVKRYRDAAEAGDARAQFRLAYLYENGLVTGARDIATAARWYAASAKGGYPPAQFKYAVFLQTGRGVDADRARAAEYYRLAAKAGVAEAAYNLAAMLVEGSGVERDTAAAIEFYEQAALSGKMTAAALAAMTALGDLYASDIAGVPDPVEAWAWYRLAMEAGATVNAERIAAIEGNLDAAGMAEARRLREAYRSLRKSRNSN